MRQKALGYSIYTEGETLEKVKESIKDAVRCHFGNKTMPSMIRFHLVKDELMPV